MRGDEIPCLWNAKPLPFPLRLGFLLSLFSLFSPVILFLSAVNPDVSQSCPQLILHLRY